MRIDKRLFPYPVLNKNPTFSQYKSSVFELTFEDEVNDNFYTLKNLICNIQNTAIVDLIISGRARIVLVIECSATMFRKNYTLLPLMPVEIQIPISDLNGKVSIRAYVVATCNISNFYSDDFEDIYKGYTFDIEKNDILAIDDGFDTRIDFKTEQEDEKPTSIFVLVKDKNIKDDTIKISFDMDKIEIALDESSFNTYIKLRGISNYQSIFISLLGVPSLTHCLESLKSEGQNVESLCLDYSWFNSFCRSFNQIFNCEFTDDTFRNADLNLIVQKVLNSPLSKSFKDLESLTTMKVTTDEN